MLHIIVYLIGIDLLNEIVNNNSAYNVLIVKRRYICENTQVCKTIVYSTNFYWFISLKHNVGAQTNF